MTIQWFPGHMTKARRQIEGKLKLIDLVIELLDARVPLSSRNPMVDEILKDKPRIVLLNKADLADPAVTNEWVQFFKKQKLDALPIDSISGSQVQEILPRSKQLLKHKIDAQLRKGIKPRAIRSLIVGIPNVGKSTLINRLAGKKIAETGDKPGVTKAQQWIKIGTEMELLDTPGILWPKFEDQNVGIRLAATGAIKETLINLDDIAFHVIRYFLKEYPERLNERYGIEEVPEDLSDPNEIVNIMEEIGQKRGCIKRGGIIDLEKTSSIILREMRAGTLGRFSLETPGEDT
ncbi:ribosome biogenesis GTPase YlqF [Chengkuizengella axinellae]|uniref:Ribosome biogenesis GTPase A n=1 Tax=Chengkuizengella axinellae TaxID=3064388 RepID=A0ABT9IX86_9BACL|nr:ribosome biogenesis GTPase YlqF [Chengkuizengella sp. 2205SS18-9]MDP5273419.1 ribosome biogenesis GTPase YlqF [Chengkuizengella sp. 2205SS18-9]